MAITYKKIADGQYTVICSEERLGGGSYGVVRKVSEGKWAHSGIEGFYPTRMVASQAAIDAIQKKRSEDHEKAKKAWAERQEADRIKIEALRTGDWEENATNWLSQLTLPGLKSSLGWEEGKMMAFVTKEGVKIEMDVASSRYCLGNGAKSTFHISGHTKYEMNGKWYTFDQRGISDSFYVQDEPGFFSTVDEVISEQLERIQKSIERHKNSIPVPGLPYSVTPENRSSISKKLQAGGTHLFSPAGMGIAHEVSTRNTPYSRMGSPDLAEFFGVARLFITNRDWD